MPKNNTNFILVKLENFLAEIIILIYSCLTFLFHPFASLYLRSRVSLNKEDRQRYREKLGYLKQIYTVNNILESDTFKGPLWFHTASVGELQSIIPLLKALREQDKDSPILVTTCTKTGYDIFLKANIARSAHCYVPIDTPQAVYGFLKFWEPKLAVFVESEIWPNIIKQTQRACNIILCNARLSPNSFRRWKYAGFIFRNLLSPFTAILASTEETFNRLKILGISRAEYAGNLKYAAPPLSFNSDELKKLTNIIGDRPVLLVASTHEPEEELFINIYSKLVKTLNNLLMIIVPRHPERSQEIIGLLKGVKYAVRSQNHALSSTTSIYLADTIGELGLFYRLADLVFIGGSMIPHGGQNMLEPARLGCAIIVGPYTFNFNDIMAQLVKNEAIVQAFNEEELFTKVEDLLLDEEKCKALANQAFSAAKVQEDSLEKNLLAITNAYRWEK